jgi:predicted amidohydrolase YtcJ
MVMDAHQLGFQVAIHSVEESVIESACLALEKALTAVPRVDHRHRLEHCFLCPDSLMNRISSLGACVVTQPAFIYQNGDRYIATVPEEKKTYLYPIHSLMKRGIMTAAGSDCPVGAIDPFIGIYGATTRNTRNKKSVNRKERVDLLDSLKLFTCNAAYTVFEEDFKGSIEVGKTADLILLSQNLLQEYIESLKEVCVDMTIIDGKIVWDNRS